MHLFWITWWLELLYGTYLIEIHLYSSVGDHVAEEFANPHTENALIGIEAQPMLLKYFKYICKVTDMPLIFLALHHHVSDVNFYHMADLLSKLLDHHPLIGGPYVL